jgi:hypothetical protein
VLLLLLYVTHPAAPAPPTAQPPAAAAPSRTKSAAAEVAGGRSCRQRAHQGGHGRRVLPAFRHQANHALRRCPPKTLLPFRFRPRLEKSNLLTCQLPCSVLAGVCNLCNGGVRFVREHDPNRYSRAAQSSVKATAIQPLIGSSDGFATPTGASGTCRCRASPGGSSCRGQGGPLTTSPALFSSRKTGAPTISSLPSRTVEC